MDNLTNLPAPERVLLFRVYHRGGDGKWRHIASANHPEDAARVANAWGSGTRVYYRGRCVADIAVNGTDCTQVVVGATIEADAEA